MLTLDCTQKDRRSASLTETSELRFVLKIISGAANAVTFSLLRDTSVASIESLTDASVSISWA